MKDSVRTKLETLEERYQEISALLSEGSIIADQKKFRALSQEYSEIEDVVFRPLFVCFSLLEHVIPTT
jgi:peptide chain release factor 1